MTPPRHLTNVFIPVLLVCMSGCGDAGDSQSPAVDASTEDTRASDTAATGDTSPGVDDTSTDAAVDTTAPEDARTDADVSVAEDTTVTTDTAVTPDTATEDAADTSGASDVTTDTSVVDVCEGVPRCRVVDGVNCPCGLSEFDPNLLVVTFRPPDLGVLTQRLVLVDGTKSPTVCALGESPTQAPVSAAKAIYIDLDRDISSFERCEGAAGSTRINYREFSGGAMVGSMTSVSAGISAEAFWERCHLDVEALFPNGDIWTYSLQIRYQSGGYSTETVCSDL